MRRKFIRTEIGICLLIVTGLILWQVWKQMNLYSDKTVLKLENAYSYNAENEKILTQMQEEISITFWEEEENIEVTNPDFSRTIQVDTLAIAGDSSLLFPNANVLGLSDEGYCILGVQTARQLFGSTQVNGRSIMLHEKKYIVAGIEYNCKNICVYELGPNDNAVLDYAIYSYSNQSDKNMVARNLENNFQISGEDAKMYLIYSFYKRNK